MVRGIVVYEYIYYHNGKDRRVSLIICPNCHKLNYVGVPKIMQLLTKPFEGLIVRKTLSKLGKATLLYNHYHTFLIPQILLK